MNELEIRQANGQAMRKRREELSMTQDALAKKLGYKHRASIARIEAGVASIPPEKANEFAYALNYVPETFPLRIGFARVEPLSYEDYTEERPYDFKWAQPLVDAYHDATTDTKKAVCAVLGIPYIRGGSMQTTVRISLEDWKKIQKEMNNEDNKYHEDDF